MTVGELRKHLNDVPTAYDSLEVKVWLPGSKITLGPFMGLRPAAGKITPDLQILIEGNVDEGSALESLVDRNAGL